MEGVNPVVALAHQTIEQTELAKQMEHGTVDREAYASYLRSSLAVWWSLEDRFALARELGVSDRVLADLDELTDGDPQLDKTSLCAAVHAERAKIADLRVLGLGLCYGGKLMAKRISEHSALPVSHFHMPEGSIATLRALDAPQYDIVEAFRRTTEWYRDAV